ncbi:Hypothetical protein I5071_910 (plasmid) [Sandaracinus amylolyticus]|nr:Hypothetical protein I5071_910 [Sandaracinus amylolyticus]
MLANAFEDPRSLRTYSVQYLFGTSFRREAPWWDCGAFVALERAGAIAKVQPPADQVPKAWVGPSGFAFNEYWLSALACSPDVHADEREDGSGEGSDEPVPEAGPDPPPLA